MLPKSQTTILNGVMSRSMPFSSNTLPSAVAYGTFGVGQPIIPPTAPPFFDPRNLEIKTKSVEQTLLPLVTQVCLYVLNILAVVCLDIDACQLQREFDDWWETKIRTSNKSCFEGDLEIFCTSTLIV